MQITKCNHCGKEQERKDASSGTAPVGWYQVSRVGGTDANGKHVDWNTNIHLCSPVCMIQFADAVDTGDKVLPAEVDPRD